MLKLAICDDEAAFLEKAEKAVLEFNRTHKESANFVIEKYVSPQLLYDDVLDGKSFDVFLLDMEMEEMSGVALATRIREQFSSAIIIFLSCHTEFQFTQEGYKVQALRYVSKLLMETTLPEALEVSIQTYERLKPQYFIFSHYTENIRIPLNEIIYIQKVKRMTVVHTEKQGEFQIKRPLRDIFGELNDIRFAYVDQSCIVNLNYVAQLKGSETTLSNGIKLPVSRKMTPALKSSMLRLWGDVK